MAEEVPVTTAASLGTSQGTATRAAAAAAEVARGTAAAAVAAAAAEAPAITVGKLGISQGSARNEDGSLTLISPLSPYLPSQKYFLFWIVTAGICHVASGSIFLFVIS